MTINIPAAVEKRIAEYMRLDRELNKQNCPHKMYGTYLRKRDAQRFMASKILFNYLLKKTRD